MTKSKSTKHPVETEELKPFNRLMEDVLERVEVEDTRLKASVDKWVEAMRERFIVESGLYDSIHIFSDESREKSVELFKAYLERELHFQRAKLALYEIKRKHNDLQETIELIDGHTIDNENSSIKPIALMVGCLNMSKVNAIYDQLYRLSMVNLGLLEEVGDIHEIIKYEAYEVLDGIEVRLYIEEFQNLIQSGDEELKKGLNDMVNDIEMAKNLSQSAKNPILRMFAMLVIYNEQKGEDSSENTA